MSIFEEMAIRNEERINASEKALAEAIKNSASTAAAISAEFQRGAEAGRREMASLGKLLHRDMVLLTLASSLFAVLGPKALALIAMVVK